MKQRFCFLWLGAALSTWLAGCHEANEIAQGDAVTSTHDDGLDTSADTSATVTTTSPPDDTTEPPPEVDDDIAPDEPLDAADDTLVPIDVDDTFVPPDAPDADDTDDTVIPDDTLPPDDTFMPPDTDDTVVPEDTFVPPEDTFVPPEDTFVPPEDTFVPPDIVAPIYQIVVNELDCRGTPVDWVEVVNIGTTDVPLADVWVTDELDDPTHRTPLGAADQTLIPGGRYVVELATFGVACGSEGVTLGRGAATVIDASPAGNDPSGYTYGRLPDITGNFTITKPTRGAPNLPPDLDPFDEISTLYDPLHAVPTIDLTLEDWAVDSLFNDPYAWVPGTFALTDDLGTFTQPAAIRIKGRIGSFRDLDGKSAFKIDFDRYWPGGRFRGVEAMTLNNMVQDNAKMHEVFAYAYFRALGVPAPRVGYVWVRVNGDDFGLYANIEAYDNPFFDRHFATTKVMFEGAYGDDLFDGMAFQFDLDHGEEAGRIDLGALIDAVQAAPTNGFMAAVAPFLDWDEATRDMAAEILTGHWDGYAPTRNNYYLVGDDAGVFRMMPWGIDQTFESNWAWYSGQGLLFQGCVNDPPCRQLYEDKLIALSAIVESREAIDWLAGVPAVIQPYVDIEPREGGGVNVATRHQQAVDFILRRAREVREQIGCVRDPNLDIDGDGAACSADCNEGDPDTYLGAPEVCGDLIDQDCNDIPDDGPDCPDCTPVARDARQYAFCRDPKTHDEAATYCSDQGMTLVIVNGQSENTWLRDTGSQMGFNTFWLGLDDLVQEGTFVWDDGVRAGDRFRDWISGEPNNSGGEDCVQMYPSQGSDTWNDIGCGAQLSVVCEQP